MAPVLPGSQRAHGLLLAPCGKGTSAYRSDQPVFSLETNNCCPRNRDVTGVKLADSSTSRQLCQKLICRFKCEYNTLRARCSSRTEESQEIPTMRIHKFFEKVGV